MYMRSLGIRGRNPVGSDFKTIMPHQNVFRVPEPETCEALGTMKEAVSVSEAYESGPEVMERRKNTYP